jgi:hypothetical protein
MAIYIRLTLAIARKEELLEQLRPRRTNQWSAWKTNQRAASHDPRQHRTFISDSTRTRVVRVNPNRDHKTTEMRRIPASDDGPGSVSTG